MNRCAGRGAKNLEGTANVFSKLLYNYMNGLLWKAWKKGIEEKDIPQVLEANSSATITSRYRKLSHKYKKNILISFAYSYWSKITLLCVVQCCLKIMEIGQSLLLNLVLSNFEQNKTLAYVFSLILFLLQSACMTLNRFAIYHLIQTGIRLRVYCWNQIFIKLLESKCDLFICSRIFNMISNECNMMDLSLLDLSRLFSVPFSFIAVCLFAYFIIGPTGLIAVAVLCLAGFLLPVVGWGVKTFSCKYGKYSDIRSKEIATFVSSMSVAKMSAIDHIIYEKIRIFRRNELKWVMLLLFTLAIIPASQISFTLIGIVIVINLISIQGMPIPTLDKIFSLLPALTKFQETLLDEGNRGIATLFMLKAFGKRTKIVLSLPTIDSKIKFNMISTDEILLSMANVHAKWQQGTIFKFSISVRKNDFIAITGENGSGKTSLILSILGEMPIVEGSLQLEASVSYAPQEPWLFAGTIRRNILFGSKFNSKRYKEVVNACCLEEDFKHFMNQDMTIIGPDGMGLSGGQKARVSLARAIYRDAEMYLLDDPFGSMDALTANEVFKRCVRQLLRDKTVILVTQQHHYMKKATCVYKINYDFVLEKFESLPKHLKKVDSAIRPFPAIEKYNSRTQLVSNVDKISEIKNELDSISYSSRNSEQFDGYAGSPVANEEEVDYRMLAKYFHIGFYNYFVAFLFLIFCCGVQGLIVYVDVWLSKWLEDQGGKLVVAVRESYNYFRNVFIGLIMAALISALLRDFLFRIACVNTSRRSHAKSLFLIWKTSISYFTNEKIVSILKRFSADVGILDKQIPDNMSIIMQNLFVILASIIYVAIANPFSILVISPLLLFIFVMQLIYNKCARQVLKIENSARAPIINHVNTVIKGMPIIRAFDMENTMITEMQYLTDKHTSAAMTIRVMQKWYQIRIELGFAMFFFIYTCILISLKSIPASTASLSLVYVFKLSNELQYCIRMFTDTFNTLISFGKVTDFFDLKPERIEVSGTIEENIINDWPQKGNLIVDGVSFKYSLLSKYILDNVSFSIKDGQKVAIVGRTGAGKSTILNMIYRLGIVEGTILLDGLNTGNISVTKLRRSLCIIPQNALFFRGTLRENLDPFNEVNDNYIWKTLEEVRMKERVIQSFPKGLDSQLNGVNSDSCFSQGHFQLLSIARAIIHKRKFTIMDEATSNLDFETDKIVQEVIRSSFKDCTLIAIAHRIGTILDFDIVFVIDNGSIVEKGRPKELLNQDDSYFLKIARENGLDVASLKFKDE